jgi:hypothetical protein
MTEDDGSGKKLLEIFHTLSQEVDDFMTDLKDQLEGVVLTDHIQTVKDSCFKEVQILRSDLKDQWLGVIIYSPLYFKILTTF